VSRQRRAIKAFEDFKGEKPAKLRRSRLPDTDVTGWEMGPMVGVAYEARRDGKTQQYFHEFKAKARPRLVAQDDGRQLYIDGGRYKVTDRGIEDMPNLMVVNPSPRSGKSKPSKKGNTMARRARRRRSHVSVFTSNPRRRRRARPAARRAVFARNPVRRRRRRAAGTAARRVYRRNPSRRSRRVSTRRYRRNPIGGAGVGKLSSLVLPAVFIGLGAVGTEIIIGYLPLPMAWKVGPMKYIVKGAVGVAIGLVIAKGFKQKRLGYYFGAGAIAIATHDFVKSWLATNAAAIKGLGYVNPGSVAKFGQYQRALPMNRFGGRLGEYGPALRSQFGGDSPIANARAPGGEMNFAA
jgi:hypothetical protein